MMTTFKTNYVPTTALSPHTPNSTPFIDIYRTAPILIMAQYMGRLQSD